MSKDEIRARIKLTGMWQDYTVILSGYDGQADIRVTSYLVGRNIVASIRRQAEANPERFPAA